MEQTISNRFQVIEVQLTLKRTYNVLTRPCLNTSWSAADIFFQTWDKNIIQLQEQFKIIYLNKHNYIIGLYELSSGGTSTTVADVKLIFATGLKLMASKLMVAHNHPSGLLVPSVPDNKITKMIKEAGKLLEMELLDHIILSPEGEYYSYAEDGGL